MQGCMIGITSEWEKRHSRCGPGKTFRTSIQTIPQAVSKLFHSYLSSNSFSFYTYFNQYLLSFLFLCCQSKLAGRISMYGLPGFVERSPLSESSTLREKRKGSACVCSWRPQKGPGVQATIKSAPVVQAILLIHTIPWSPAPCFEAFTHCMSAYRFTHSDARVTIKYTCWDCDSVGHLDNANCVRLCWARIPWICFLFFMNFPRERLPPTEMLMLWCCHNIKGTVRHPPVSLKVKVIACTFQSLHRLNKEDIVL